MSDRMEVPQRKFGWPPPEEPERERCISALILADIGKPFDEVPPWIPTEEDMIEWMGRW
jgi:hypothetical protein